MIKNNHSERKFKSKEVDKYINQLEHPLKKEIELLRGIILESSSELSEIIKWNAPSYVYRHIDCITFKVYPTKAVQLIFHRGAKTKTPPKERLIKDSSGLLTWKENDRAVATFATMDAIESKKDNLRNIVQDWVGALN